MHSPVQKKYAAKAAHGSHSEQGKIFLLDNTSPVQKKYAAKAAHGSRSEQGKIFPYSIEK